MFKEIRRQMTLFNVLILMAFLLLFIFLITVLLTWSLKASGEAFFTTLTQQLISGEDLEEANTGLFSSDILHNKIDYNYIEWNESKQISEMKSKNDDLIMRGYELLNNPDILNKFMTIDINGTNYRFYTTQFDRQDGKITIQLYQQTDTEYSLLRYTISLLLILGIGGILLLIPISYFLAGKSLKPINEALDDQKKFIADASHELRTPLTVIRSNVEVLKMKEDEVLANNIKWLNNIDLECDTMAKLVSELLLIAQSDYKKDIMEKEVFDLSAICAEVYDSMYSLAKDNDIKLTSQIKEGIEFKGDEEKIKQAIRIFVDNAIKYTPGPGHVKLTLYEEKRNICISVKDDGIGLSEDAKRKIFSRFYRVDDARNREKGGVGLGLNIADMIVKQHNGRIRIESEPDQGSNFIIVLPKNTI